MTCPCTQPPLFPPNEPDVLGSLRDKIGDSEQVTLTRAEIVDYYFLLRDVILERDKLKLRLQL